ncbi:hypothetical protein HMI54_002535 [Coelomomyces lativittatus]|nr:hypothetical protein HMI54_002535 [Coelomomyces lativittatus]KAJ1515894.1 hypothetical protein HMI55_003250 [Coelomomyces lativittatus]
MHTYYLARGLHRSFSNVVSSAIPAANELVLKEGVGGRCSVSGRIATVFGCTGFIGRMLVNRLAKQGTQVIVPYRSEDIARNLKPMGDLGQIVPRKFSIYDHDSLMSCVRHSDVVYNLIGKDYETKSFTFEQALVDSAHNIAYACRSMDVPMLIHMSHLNADSQSTSKYMRAKAKSEEKVKDSFPNATVVRCASVYGFEDRFVHLLDWLNDLPFFFPMYNSGKTQFLPVCGSDIASALTYLAFHPNTVGKTCEFYGPKAYTFEELVDWFSEMAYKHKPKMHIPKNLALLHAYLTDKSDLDPFLSTDIIERLYIDEQPRLPDALTLKDVGVVKPNIFEYTAVEYIRVFRDAASYDLPGPMPSKSEP